MISHQDGLSSGWSLIRVVSHQGDHSSGWSLIRVVSHHGGLSSGWSLIRVVSHQSGLSSVITGSQEHNMAVRSALVDHMVSIPAVFGGNVEDYLVHTNMNRSETWGTLKKCLGCLIC